MSIYKDLLNAVSNGKKFKVDLIEKSLWIDKKKIIEKGEIIDEQDKSKELICPDDLIEYGWEDKLDDCPWLYVESLYNDYKHSVPSENGNHKSYFKALPVDELTDFELAYNSNRGFSQAMLEGYILLSSLEKWLQWDAGERWFWQSNDDKDLVLLKNWIE